MIPVHDKKFEIYITREEIKQRVEEVAKKISKDYAQLNPLFLGILNGSYVFAADLMRAMTTNSEISFIKLASYSGMQSTGDVVTAIGMDENIHGRHVIVLEDIVDTGKTMSSFMPELFALQPASIKLASFLSKPEARHHNIHPDYVCFEIPNSFVVGYGLDYDGHGRNLPDLYILAAS